MNKKGLPQKTVQPFLPVCLEAILNLHIKQKTEDQLESDLLMLLSVLHHQKKYYAKKNIKISTPKSKSLYNIKTLIVFIANNLPKNNPFFIFFNPTLNTAL